MGQRTDIWTYLIITAVSVLVWYGAASETRVTKTLRPIRVEFRVPGAGQWLIDPPESQVTITAAGSQRSIRNVEQLDELIVELAAVAEGQEIDLFKAVAQNALIEESGVSIVSVTPAEAKLDVDQFVRIPAPVRAILAGVQTGGEVEVTPPEVTVSMPSRLRPFYPDDLTVEALLQGRELDRLEPGVAHTIDDVTLRLPSHLPSDSSIAISPQRVRLKFTVLSQIRDLVLEKPVRIKIAGAPEDLELVEIEPKQLREVTVSAPFDVIEQIESGAATVVAMLHLRSSEKEARITSKPLTCFLVLTPPDDTGVPIDARVGSAGETQPVINITIRERSAE